MDRQSDIDHANAGFWDELCGTQLAKSLGVTDASPASLKRFDDWYMAFYPYLYDHIPFAAFRDKDVLEVGLGYGTVSQKIAESGARYCGLDIAANPVARANDRARHVGHAPTAQQGSILVAPFADASFDYVVAIGCLHHTGNMKRAIDECHRLLRRGGRLIFMVYYAYSYRRFVLARRETLRYWLREMCGYRGVVFAGTDLQRAAYDANQAGDAAPHTDFISMKSLASLCSTFSSFSARTENIDQERPFSTRPRAELLGTRWPRLCGLDVYATAVK
jgi:SAM-dependent methyltransferase